MDQTCIVPGCDYPADSREHVVLSALGGRKKLKGVFCKCSEDREGCNKRLGDLLDAPLTEAYKPFTTFLNVAGDRSRRRTTGPTLRGVKGEDGRTYDIRGGGQPKLQKVEVEVSDLPGDKKGVRIVARSPEEAKRLLAAQFKRFGVDPENPHASIQSANVTHYKGYPTMEIESISLSSPEHLRAATKMSLALLAGSTDMVQKHAASFADALDFMNSGAGEAGKLANHNYGTSFPCPQTDRDAMPFDHSVTVCGEKGKPLVGFVTLFGHFKFTATLSPSAPETVAVHYEVCPQSGTHETIEDFSFDPAACDSTLFPRCDEAEILAAFNMAWGKVQKQGGDEGVSAVIEKGLDLLRQHDGEIVTEELLDKVVRQVSEGMTAHLLRLPQETDVTSSYFEAQEDPPTA